MLFWIVVSVLIGMGVAVLLARTARLPHRRRMGQGIDERVEDVEAYLVESEEAWRLSARRFAAVVGSLVAVVGIFTTVLSQERDQDNEESQAFQLSSCRAVAENRQQQRNRDDRVVADFERELQRLDTLIEEAVQPEDIPGVDATLMPVLVFLAESRDAQHLVDREQLVIRLEDARAESALYAETFPIPPCDVEAGLLHFEDTPVTPATGSAVPAVSD